ncbi:Rz1-like lysis system protein LysC [Enterovibrio norvegicus]|uniref:Rz1-like lysis system protein LysC n=1 Tax=Enterovibrio norvegicus TaxID=188144 RepID=UPI003BB188CA
MRRNNQIVVACLCLMTLSACAVSEPPPPPVKTAVIYRTPPAAYTVDCVVPPFTGNTWADLAADNAALIAVITACDKRFKYIRAWRNTPPSPTENDPSQ